jgi:hypothetical protein
MYEKGAAKETKWLLLCKPIYVNHCIIESDVCVCIYEVWSKLALPEPRVKGPWFLLPFTKALCLKGVVILILA